ncbi:hypothetical protein ADUPG1_014237 [Aduncisulcus paluster]|uniref:Uncharacterized protein n=1 Tax=Aduncisulcus paluster TaxID=2918883 RepID=A0ABQ5KB99_9EUKA|nr:hypothetical protein ADUPG1_014237 [Aduncisulcus paluster]
MTSITVDGEFTVGIACGSMFVAGNEYSSGIYDSSGRIILNMDDMAAVSLQTDKDHIVIFTDDEGRSDILDLSLFKSIHDNKITTKECICASSMGAFPRFSPNGMYCSINSFSQASIMDTSHWDAIKPSMKEIMKLKGALFSDSVKFLSDELGYFMSTEGNIMLFSIRTKKVILSPYTLNTYIYPCIDDSFVVYKADKVSFITISEDGRISECCPSIEGFETNPESSSTLFEKKKGKRRHAAHE